MIGDELGLMTNEEVDELESKSDWYCNKSCDSSKSWCMGRFSSFAALIFN